MAANLQAFRDMLREVLPRNRFYARKYASSKIDADDFQASADLARLPFLIKTELMADQLAHPPYGEIMTYPLDRYCRLHQTSGTTTGKPLRCLDTPASWDRLLTCWTDSFPIMGITRGDKFFFPFSFGPFLGFWTAFEAATRSGFLCLPGGGMSSTARLQFLLEHAATVVCCTPTYALHLAELASKEGIDLKSSAVRAIIVAGEPGGCIPATRQRIETVWGARVFDHYGLTEVGPVAAETNETPEVIMFLENHYIGEVIDPITTETLPEGQAGELVLTNLGRWGFPLIRYRTGDLVKMERIDGRLSLVGGILGRTDDMIYVRGNNFYPAAIEAVVRRFPEVVEYRIVVDHTGPLTDLRIEIEPVSTSSDFGLADAVARAIRDELLFRVEVSAVPTNSLPRFEMKAKRVVHQR